MAEATLVENHLVVTLSRDRAVPFTDALELPDHLAYELGHTMRVALADPIFMGEYVELMRVEAGWRLVGITPPYEDQ